jgi:flagellar basal body-associated protein FliL
LTADDNKIDNRKSEEGKVEDKIMNEKKGIFIFIVIVIALIVAAIFGYA